MNPKIIIYSLSFLSGLVPMIIACGILATILVYLGPAAILIIMFYPVILAFFAIELVVLTVIKLILRSNYSIIAALAGFIIIPIVFFYYLYSPIRL